MCEADQMYIDDLEELVGELTDRITKLETNKIHCSFCGKSVNDVRHLIAGNNVYICDECVELCTQIIYEKLGGN